MAIIVTWTLWVFQTIKGKPEISKTRSSILSPPYTLETITLPNWGFDSLLIKIAQKIEP